MKVKKSRLSYNGRKALYGYGFISLWIVGFIYFFVRLMIMSVRYSVNDITFQADGMSYAFNNFSVYKFLIFDDPTLLRQMVGSFTSLIYRVPLIVILSIMIAVLLNNKYFGVTFFRASFFLPVIITSGAVLSIIKGNQAMAAVSGESATYMLQVSDFGEILAKFNLPEKLSDMIMSLSNMAFDLLWKTGIQILLFLAGLKTISVSVYEAASIEGASKWDCFWKITIPMLSPVILLAVIYTIVESFTDSTNPVMSRIFSDTQYLKYTEASVLAVVYFVLAMVFIGAVYAVLNRLLPYSSERR